MPREPKCLCGHDKIHHIGPDNRGKCMGRVRMMIVTKSQVPPKYQKDSDVWLTKEEAEALVDIGHKKVLKDASYEHQFNKGLKRGYFSQDCDCDLRSSLERAKMIQTP